MQELEKILYELEKRIFTAEVYNDDFDGTTITNLICLGDVRDILEKHMNDGWIPVEKALPEYGKKVLAYGKSGEIDIASLYSRDKHMWLVGSMCSVAFDIIAWRTLPAPYRPERSEK